MRYLIAYAYIIGWTAVIVLVGVQVLKLLRYLERRREHRD